MHSISGIDIDQVLADARQGRRFTPRLGMCHNIFDDDEFAALKASDAAAAARAAAKEKPVVEDDEHIRERDLIAEQRMLQARKDRQLARERSRGLDMGMGL